MKGHHRAGHEKRNSQQKQLMRDMGYRVETVQTGSGRLWLLLHGWKRSKAQRVVVYGGKAKVMEAYYHIYNTEIWFHSPKGTGSVLAWKPSNLTLVPLVKHLKSYRQAVDFY